MLYTMKSFGNFNQFTCGNHDLLLLSDFSRVRLFAALWTVTQQTPLFMGFSSQEYWSELPCWVPNQHLRYQSQSHMLCTTKGLH